MILPERLRGDIVNDELAEAERAVRVTAVSWSRHDDKALEVVMAEYDRRGQELDRIRRVRCLGHVYSGLQPPEQCGDYAGHEGKCQP